MPHPNSRLIWVVSRRSTRQTVFAFPPDIQDAKRKAMLRMQVRRWAPYPNVKYVAQWSANRASVYAWNDDEIKKSIADAGLSKRRCVIYPETFVRAPLQEGVRLVAAIEGFEAQVWQQGLLAYSRWWPHSPSQGDWDMFLRSSGIPLDQHVGPPPETATAEFLESPWVRQEGYLGVTWSLLEDPRYAAALATLVAAPFVYLGMECATLAIANARVTNNMEVLSVETQGIRKVRAAALSNLDVIEDYLSLEVYRSQFEVMTLALGLLQTLNVKIPEWTYDVGTLSFILRPNQDIDATALITAFEKSGAFANVTASRAGQGGGQEGQIRVRMDVLPKPIKTQSR